MENKLNKETTHFSKDIPHFSDISNSKKKDFQKSRYPNKSWKNKKIRISWMIQKRVQLRDESQDASTWNVCTSQFIPKEAKNRIKKGTFRRTVYVHAKRKRKSWVNEKLRNKGAFLSGVVKITNIDQQVNKVWTKHG